MEEKKETLKKNITGMLEHIEDLPKLERIYYLTEYLYIYADNPPASGQY